MKLTLNDVGDLSSAVTAKNTINANNAAIETALENTLSRDGTAPNKMGSVIDMDSNNILNLPKPTQANSPLRLQDLSSFLGSGTVSSLPAGGTINQALSKNSSTDFDVSWKTVPGGGTVTSVGLSLPADITVTGSPVTTNGTLTGAWANTPTGTGGIVRTTSPTLVTPILGVATATSVNKVAITAPATSATITVANGATLSAPSSATVSGTNTGDQTITLTGDVTGNGNNTFAATIGNNVVTNAKLDLTPAYTLKGNSSSSSASPTDISIPALTTKASPVSGDLILIADSAASNAFKKVTVGSISSAGSVSSIAGNTGAFTLANGITNSTNVIKRSYNEAISAATAAAPTGTVSTTGVMMGLGSGFALTMTNSTRVLVTISGNITSSVANNYGTAQIRYGTGVAPSNGAALTGTAVGTNFAAFSQGAAYPNPTTLSTLISGLTIGTTYWFDLGVASGNASNTASFGAPYFFALEV